MSPQPRGHCRLAITENEIRACKAARYKMECRSWRAVARIVHARDAEALREEAIAHLSLEGDRLGLLVQEYKTAPGGIAA